MTLLRSRAIRLAEEMSITLVALFGSWVKGRETASSDIDVLIVYREPRRPDAFNTVSRTLGIAEIEPHIFTVEEFEAFVKNSPRTKKEWVEDAIIIYQNDKSANDHKPSCLFSGGSTKQMLARGSN